VEANASTWRIAREEMAGDNAPPDQALLFEKLVRVMRRGFAVLSFMI